MVNALLRRAPLAAACAVAAGAAWHIGPAATWLPAVRSTLAPGLDGRGRADHVALPIDDGPDPASTPRFLRVLDELSVHATFFMIGSAVVRHPRTARAVAEAGHEIAVHGWDHDRPWLPGLRREARGLAETSAAVHRVCGARPRWYRPPYGILTGARLSAARGCGLRTVLWSAWGKDWTDRATGSSVLAELAPGLQPGATLLLHDADGWSAPGAWHATLDALPAVVDACRRQQLTVGPLADHGVPGTPGTAPASS
jgi:peptidoglycan/xylan/chitin deacetylase (PgdA/CDA1 family)